MAVGSMRESVVVLARNSPGFHLPGTPELRYAVDAGAVGSTRESMVALASSSPGFHLPRTPKLRYAVDAGAWKRMESSSAARSPGPT